MARSVVSDLLWIRKYFALGTHILFIILYMSLALVNTSALIFCSAYTKIES
jgi:hypothetical protein